MADVRPDLPTAEGLAVPGGGGHGARLALRLDGYPVRASYCDEVVTALGRSKLLRDLPTPSGQLACHSIHDVVLVQHAQPSPSLVISEVATLRNVAST